MGIPGYNKYTFKFRKLESIGKIEDGKWNLKAKPLKGFEKYQAVEKHFRNGLSFEETGIIDHLLERMEKENRSTIYSCSTKEELKSQYNKIDDLYESLKKEGYRKEKHKSHGYVAFHVGRYGEFIFAGSGLHRLSIARILDLDEIPVWIRGRHKLWQEKREKIFDANSIQELNDNLKKYLDHPDMKDIINGC